MPPALDSKVSISSTHPQFSILRLPRPRLLVRIPRLAVLAHPHLAALLVDDVLDPHLVALRALELADEARVPQLRRHAQVLAAPQQRVRLAPLARRRDGLFGKVLALAARLGDEAAGEDGLDTDTTTERKGRKRR